MLWTVALTVIGLVAAMTGRWIELRKTNDPRPFQNALRSFRWSGTCVLGAVAALVFIAFAVFFVRTVYFDHQQLTATNERLSENVRTLSSEVEWRKHNISATDPLFSNINQTLLSFDVFRHALNGAPCVVMVTAPPESGQLASVVAQFSNSVSGCFTFGPMNANIDPNVETETMNGMVPDKVVFHAASDDKAADQLFVFLGNQIQLKRSYQLPPKPNYQLPPSIHGRVHVVWLQFGTNAKWNSELFSRPSK